ncbi:MAG: PglZ domain-containing protein [Chromatiaceae bacterium]|nr:PglZ domain-containing protein [Chromatiaceae bacterium]
MNAFHDYLCEHLDDLLHKHSVVVFYDPRREFRPFFDRELEPLPGDPLPRVTIGTCSAFLARYEGSFFGLRAAVEPIVAADQPEPLVLYLPGIARDRLGSVLMELERAGTCYEPQLKRLALNVLRQRFTDGQIDEMLRPATVTYDDIVAFLAQGGAGQIASVLHTLFAGAQGEVLLTQWLASDAKDEVLVKKEAVPELFKLIKVRLGLDLPPDMSLAKARERTCRYVLVNEFRADLSCAPPKSVAMVPGPPGKDPAGRIREVAEGLRRHYPDAYEGLADAVEQGLGLAGAAIEADGLGSIDTFRFEEERLLAHAAALIARKDYAGALAIVMPRGRSFWVDREFRRQAQWEACRLMAELGLELERVRAALGRMGTDAVRWVAAYTAEEGWHRVDGLQRRLETWVARMDDEPEAEQALAVIRQAHEHLLRTMADGFAKALAASAWTVPGALHQTRIYPEVVQKMGGRVAWFFVDAMRFEMGVELARQIEGAKDLRVRAAVAALPSITPVGMAALLPGASASFNLVEAKGKLAVRIEGTDMKESVERMRFLKAKVPDAVEMTLGKLLGQSPAKVGKEIGTASLVVIRSQEIDFVGETDSDLLARQVMDTVIGNLARAVRKLAAAGIEHFVITADHGHQFAIRKEDDMKTDSPGGVTLDLHRRCWIGHGGSTPVGTVRVAGAELGYQTDLAFIFPVGLGVFKAGGSLSFHHGGFSLQELVVPVVSLRLAAGKPAGIAGVQVRIAECPSAVTNRTFGLKLTAVGDLLATESIALRVLLMADAEEVGRAGMAIGGDFDRERGTLTLALGKEAGVGMILTNDACQSLRVVVLDAHTDSLLAQSDALPVKLGI